VRDAVERLLTTDSARRERVDDRDVIYLTPYYHAEGGIVRRLGQLLRSPADRLARFQEVDFERAFAWHQARRGFVLTEAQRAAVRMALTNKVSVLTGGPGVGKTATTQAIVAILQAKKGKPTLAAPTGRAAKRLAELTGESAQTLHRLLGVRPGGEAGRNADNPLDGDLLIVDEASMLDTLLANTLLKAVPTDMHLLLRRRCRSVALGRGGQCPARHHRLRAGASDSPRPDLQAGAGQRDRRQRAPDQQG
jgi:exodeoxyribonuclease V alpha subunit